MKKIVAAALMTALLSACTTVDVHRVPDNGQHHVSDSEGQSHSHPEQAELSGVGEIVVAVVVEVALEALIHSLFDRDHHRVRPRNASSKPARFVRATEITTQGTSEDRNQRR